MRPRTAPRGKKAGDAIIIGGGPSGLAMAALLGSQGLAVTVLERAMPRAAARRARADARTTALSLASAHILRQAGVWVLIAPKELCPILDIRVADGNSPACLDFHHAEIGKEPFGWIVENGIFHAALRARINQLGNVRLVIGAMARLETGEAARVYLEDGRVLAAPLSIGADGRNSMCRAAAGIETYGWDYGQAAIVCTIAHALPHDNVAVEHFLPGGPLATLPMTRQRSSIVWTERAEAAARLMYMDEREFTAALQEKVQDWLGEISLAGPRAAHPLSLLRAKRYAARRLALIGDAAHAIHPIAGQGFNLGIGDMGVLAGEIMRGARLGLDAGDPSILRAYEKRRRFADGNMVLMTDALDRLFSNSIPAVEAARRFGLAAVQRIGPLRQFFMREAMGVGRQKTEDRDQKWDNRGRGA